MEMTTTQMVTITEFRKKCWKFGIGDQLGEVLQRRDDAQARGCRAAALISAEVFRLVISM